MALGAFPLRRFTSNRSLAGKWAHSPQRNAPPQEQSNSASFNRGNRSPGWQGTGRLRSFKSLLFDADLRGWCGHKEATENVDALLLTAGAVCEEGQAVGPPANELDRRPGHVGNGDGTQERVGSEVECLNRSWLAWA